MAFKHPIPNGHRIVGGNFRLFLKGTYLDPWGSVDVTFEQVLFKGPNGPSFEITTKGSEPDYLVVNVWLWGLVEAGIRPEVL